MWYFVVLIACLQCTQAYRAAVVHFYPRSGSTPNQTIYKNLEQYQKFTSRARAKNVDIVVFPEYSLVTTDAVSNPEKYAVDVTNDDIVKQVSTIASQNRVYLVMNLFEKRRKDNETKFYNTNLVFDRKGTIILKYDKIHLFNENQLTPGSLDQKPIFITDFGVTFGIFTCFDIIFVNPSQTVLQGTNVTDVIFVTGWLPSYISLSVEQGYSVSNKVNILAANYGKIRSGHSGTGIFLAGRKKNKMVVDSPKSRLIVREVPRPSSKTSSKLCMREKTMEELVVPDGQQAYFQDINLRKKRTVKKICNSEFCCTFDITVDKNQESQDIYRTMFYDGVTYYKDMKSNIRVCALLACNEGTYTCGTVNPVGTTFKTIAVSGRFLHKNATFYRPLTLSTSTGTNSPLENFNYCESEGTNRVVHLSSKFPKDVLAFGVFARTDSHNDLDLVSAFNDFIVLFWGLRKN